MPRHFPGCAHDLTTIVIATLTKGAERKLFYQSFSLHMYVVALAG
jgi:hypothetical protein